MGLPVVDDLGDAVERAWSRRDYAPDCFADLSVQHLLTARLHDNLSPEQIVDWALEGRLPEQADPRANFGQPPVTLFRSRRFFISALFWVDGTTSIHDHSFSGAFTLLSGSSIETTFAFDPVRNVAEQLQFGTLVPTSARLLARGDVHPITAGPAFIHSLFHLPRPTVSLVMRSYYDVKPGIQRRYLPPGIAYNPFHEDKALERMVQLVEMLRITDDPAFVDKVGALIQRSDLHTTFCILKSCLKLANRAKLSQLIDRVDDPVVAQTFSSWVSEAERMTFVQSRRAYVRDADLRFLLAVLLNVQRREDALALVASYAPQRDPAVQVAEWLNRLSTVTMRLQVGGDGWEPNLVGLPAFSPALEAALVKALGAPAGSSDAGAFNDEESTFLARLRALPALAPLFR